VPSSDGISPLLERRFDAHPKKAGILAKHINVGIVNHHRFFHDNKVMKK